MYIWAGTIRGLTLKFPGAVQGHPRGLMNWSQYIRHTAIAIGVTFLVAAGIYIAIRFNVRELG
jgi:hypothetical protein